MRKASFVRDDCRAAPLAGFEAYFFLCLKVSRSFALIYSAMPPTVQRGPGARVELERREVIGAEPLGPDAFADLPAQHVVGALGLRRNAHDVPAIAVAPTGPAALAGVAGRQD